MNKKIILFILATLFAVDILFNAISLVKLRSYQFNQKEDIIFEVVEWIRENIPKDTQVVADDFANVYIPPEYKNMRVFKGKDQEARVERFRKLVSTYKPRFIYLNERPCDDMSLPSIDVALPPGERVRLIKVFDSSNRRYQRRSNDKFVIYELIQ